MSVDLYGPSGVGARAHRQAWLWNRWHGVPVRDAAGIRRGIVAGVTSDLWLMVDDGRRTFLLRPEDAEDLR